MIKGVSSLLTNSSLPTSLCKTPPSRMAVVTARQIALVTSSLEREIKPRSGDTPFLIEINFNLSWNFLVSSKTSYLLKNLFRRFSYCYPTVSMSPKGPTFLSTLLNCRDQIQRTVENNGQNICDKVRQKWIEILSLLLDGNVTRANCTKAPRLISFI